MPKESIYPIVNTLIYWLITIWTAKIYSQYRRQRRYSEGKKPALSVNSHKILNNKFALIVLVAVVTLTFWQSHPVFLKMHNNQGLRFFGLATACLGGFLLQISLKTLGKNYSPMFDSFEPLKLTNDGPYRYIRHPIYTANHIIYAGLFIATGSLWVFFHHCFLIQGSQRAIKNEEALLCKKFSEYQNYQQTTWRLFPYIY